MNGTNTETLSQNADAHAALHESLGQLALQPFCLATVTRSMTELVMVNLVFGHYQQDMPKYWRGSISAPNFDNESHPQSSHYHGREGCCKVINSTPPHLPMPVVLLLKDLIGLSVARKCEDPTLYQPNGLSGDFQDAEKGSNA